MLCSSALAADLNTALARIMNGRSGTAVVINIESSQLLGAYRLDVAARRLARPGSAFKPFTLIALLESGKLKPTDTLTCRRNLHVGSHNLSCTHPQTGQPFDAVTALAYSCNDFFATMGKRLTAEELTTTFQKFGFSSPTGLVKTETTGSMHPAMSEEDRQLQAIGEGEMRVTPIEMLAAYRQIALGHNATGTTLAAVQQGVAASTDYGMARLASIKGMKVAGKTGTARADGGSWTNAWFAGYAPADKPQIAVVIFLEKGTGPGDAAPLAAEIFQAWQQR